ncbi:hypothetical protein HAX54_029223, partial [Datura stramonium]|nr:hypothetical protein [Datura stramonium]
VNFMKWLSKSVTIMDPIGSWKLVFCDKCLKTRHKCPSTVLMQPHPPKRKRKPVPPAQAWISKVQDLPPKQQQVEQPLLSASAASSPKLHEVDGERHTQQKAETILIDMSMNSVENQTLLSTGAANSPRLSLVGKERQCNQQ